MHWQPRHSSPQTARFFYRSVFFVSDGTEEQRAVESLAKSDRVLKDYLRGLMTAVLNRGGGAR
jgi:hypothetical protein